MDRRGDVYRPARNDDRSRSRSRQDPSSHRKTRFDITSKDGRSPQNISSESPRSPRANPSEVTSTADLRPSMSRDPRKQREIAGEPAHVRQDSVSLPNGSLQDVIREISLQTLLDDKARQAEIGLRKSEEKERELKNALPNDNILTETLEKQRKEAKKTQLDCSQHVKDSQGRIERMISNLPLFTRDLLSNTVPTCLPYQDSAKHSNEVDELRSSVKILAEKLDTLTKQTNEQSAELKKMKEQNPHSTFGDLERNVAEKISEVRKDVDARFTTFDQILQKQDYNLKRFNQVADTVESLQKKTEQLDRHTAGHTAGEMSNLSCNSDREDDMTAIVEQQKEQKFQIANLSNTFVSCKEFKKLHSESDIMKKKLHDAVNVQGQVETRVTGLDDRMNQICADLNQVKTGLKSVTGGPASVTPEQIKNLLLSQERMQRETERIDQCLTKQIAAREAKTASESDSQAPKYSPEDFARLEKDVKTLQSFSGHYNKFYEETRTGLKELNTQYTELKKTIAEGQNATRFRLDYVDEACHDNQNVIASCVEQTKKISAQHSLLQQHVQDQISTLRMSAAQNIESSSAQIKAEIEALKVYNKQVNHSIQSLDARFSAISTQKLYHAIVATIQPLLPDIYDTNRRVKTMQSSLVTLEQKITRIHDRVEVMEKNRSDDENHADMAQLMNETSTTDADLTGHSQHIDAVALSPSISKGHEESALHNIVTKLKEDVFNFSSHLQTIETGLAALKQLTTDSIRDVISTENLEGLVEKALDDVLKRSSGDGPMQRGFFDEWKRQATMLEKATEKVTAMEVTISKDRDIIDGLHADVEVVDDLQSRMQNAQTDLTTHTKRLEQIETSLLKIAEVEKRLNEWQAESERKARDATAGEVPPEVKQIMVLIDKLYMTILPMDDRYVIVSSLASTITGKTIREEFLKGHCEVKDTQIRGGKISGSNATNRYALVWVATSPDIDAKLEVFRVELQSRTNGWKGRKVTVTNIDRQLFRKLWIEEPGSVKEHVAGVASSRQSIVASMPPNTREVSTSHSAQSEAGDTIMVKSFALPKKSIAPEDLTELPDSEDEKQQLLHTFGATSNGQRSSRPPLPREKSSKPGTPSSKAPKRGASELSSSRASSKRPRRE